MTAAVDGDPSIVADALSKVYRIYARPWDRVRHSVFGGDRWCTEVPSLMGVCLEIYPGEVFGVVGRNGSGKSTLLKLLAGVLRPSAGWLECRGRVGALLELGSGFQPAYSGRDNARVSATLMGLTLQEAEARMPAIEAFADIGEFFDRPVSTYSSGMMARVAFAVAAEFEPDILLLDEILAVGDEAFQRKCFARLNDLAARGTTIVLVSHSSELVVELCDRAALFEGGVCRFVGLPKDTIHAYHEILHPRGVAAPAQQPADNDAYEPTLVSKSVTAYAPNGAEIDRVRIVGGNDQTVNVLTRGEDYRLVYRTRFSRDAARIEFGSLIKSTTGVALGGLLHFDDDQCQAVIAGTAVEVHLPFCCTLLPGSYFLNVGVRGAHEGQLIYLHRVLDALMFRVREEPRPRVSGLVDFSTPQTPFVRAGA